METSLVVQWLGGVGSIPGQGVKIPHASWPENQNIKQKQYCSKFNTDLKNDPHKKKRKEKKIVAGKWQKGTRHWYC